MTENKSIVKSKIEAVIFDLDGVIVNTAIYHYLSWKKLADELGILFDKKINEKLKGVDRLSSLEIILKNSKIQYTPAQKHEFTTLKNRYYRQYLEQLTHEELLPGVAQALKDIKERGLKIGLASASKNVFEVIDKLQIRDQFNAISDANKIRFNKPHPEIFLTTAEMLAVSPQECIGVEDSQAGIKAVKMADMYAVGIGAPLILNEADDVIPTMEAFSIEKYLS
ncbi:MAG: beta-phosphoglucomutase [bacterium]